MKTKTFVVTLPATYQPTVEAGTITVTAESITEQLRQGLALYHSFSVAELIGPINVVEITEER